MDALMESLVGLIPSTGDISGFTGFIGDMVGTALNNTLGRLLYMVVTGINWFISIAYQFFEVFSGQLKVTYKGEPTYLTSLFIENSTVAGIYWGMAIISVALCFAFTIIAVIRKMFDGTDKMQTTMGAILGSSLKSIIMILMLNVVMIGVLNFTNVLMQQVIYIFNAGSSMTEEQSIDFTEDQFATMGRVLNTIGNYSMNPSYNSRYNLNSCFNEIRGDLLYLQDQGVFEFYYVTKDANGREVETWQSALQDLVFAANLKEELKMDVYNESVANALLDIMHTLQTNTAFYPLEHYEKTPASVYNIPFDRVLFLACTYNAALNEQFNVNPSHQDALRGPYYSGEKNIYDFMQVSQDFNLVWGFNYIIFFLIAYGIWKEMWYILLDCMARIYNMVVLYLVGPPFIALSPLDGGGKTKQWMTAFTVQCFGIFGTVIAMRLLLTFAPIIISTQLEIFPNAVMDIVAKIMLVYGCAFTARKASAMFSGILADSAGWQSITAGSLRSDWDQYDKESEANKEKKTAAKERVAQQKQQAQQAQQQKMAQQKQDTPSNRTTLPNQATPPNQTTPPNQATQLNQGTQPNQTTQPNQNTQLNQGNQPNQNTQTNQNTQLNQGTPPAETVPQVDFGTGNGGDGGGGPYSIPVPPPMPEPPAAPVAPPQQDQGNQQGDQQGELREPPPLNNNNN